MRDSDLVVPLAHEATAMRTTDTARYGEARSGAVSSLIGAASGLRGGDVDSTKERLTSPTTPMPGTRTSTTATRTTTARTTTTGSGSSADEIDHADFSIQDVVLAHLDCRQHKRNTAACQEFERDLGPNICSLYERLAAEQYRPGRSTCFIVQWPKKREVWAASYPDRVVHHLLYLKIAQRFLRSFIANSCACIPGRGTLYAADRLEGMVRSQTQNWKRPGHYLKCDVANFFVSIDKNILFAEIAKRIPEPFWLALARTIIFHDPRTDVEVKATPAELALIPPYKSLFNQPPHLGLPIGNLPSQLSANIYLDVLDQHVKHQLRARRYIRYVDDFVLLDESVEWLNFARADIEVFLPQRLGIHLNPKKTVIQPIARGIDFVGQVITPYCRRIRKRTAHDALHRIATIPAGEVFETVNSYFGLHRQATHSHHDRARIAKAAMKRGFTVDAAFTKSFRPTRPEEPRCNSA